MLDGNLWKEEEQIFETEERKYIKIFLSETVEKWERFPLIAPTTLAKYKSFC